MSGLGFNPRAVETQRGSIPPQWRHPPRRVEIAFAHAGNRTQGTSMGGLYVATTLHARMQLDNRRAPNCKRLMLHFASGAQRSSSPTEKLTHPDDTLAEWLRRRPAKPMGSPCVGSNPTGVVFASARRPRLGQARRRIVCDDWLRAAALMKKADSTLRTSQAVPHPSTIRALSCLTSEVRRDPVHSTRYGRQRRW